MPLLVILTGLVFQGSEAKVYVPVLAQSGLEALVVSTDPEVPDPMVML